MYAGYDRITKVAVGHIQAKQACTRGIHLVFFAMLPVHSLHYQIWPSYHSNAILDLRSLGEDVWRPGLSQGMRYTSTAIAQEPIRTDIEYGRRVVVSGSSASLRHSSRSCGWL